MVAAQIKERSIMTLEPFTGIKPNQDYYIADKAIVLFFQLYDLAPYAYGFPYFPISIYPTLNGKTPPQD
ncbi:RsiV family protein [Bacillus sp. EB01]|uniref:RsiV family protein n=1 Tax=Bacillus sp. EB01 TaxID=1347086 RepID=UPI001E2F2AF2|nr:RsiV family protein [Bacillus sp. EB01]